MAQAQKNYHEMQTSRNAPHASRSLDKYNNDKTPMHLDRLTQRANNNRQASQFNNNNVQEKRTSRGNIIALACGKL